MIFAGGEAGMKRTGAVIVAAGMSARMGEFKPMLPFRDSTIVRHLIGMLKEIGVDPIVVVTGYQSRELEQHLSYMGVRFVKNERYQETQMLDSVKIGLWALQGQCERILLLPADVPAILPETIRQVLKVDAKLVRTICQGRPGHPVMLCSRLAEQICAYNGDQGLRGAMEELETAITSLEVADEGIWRDVDTKKEYQELLEWDYKRGNGHPIYPLMQLRLQGEEVFFGPGTAEFLTLLDQSGSIQEACLQMGLSYSKGRRMIRTVERQMGFSVVMCRSGGFGGGGSVLTDEGRKLVNRYRNMVQEVEACTKSLFGKYFGRGFRNIGQTDE